MILDAKDADGEPLVDINNSLRRNNIGKSHASTILIT